ncbi:GTP cyclohydrolase II [Orrella daihaiensis]|uniref:GTP cyclohydrolase-2 n=1 Tax=Orrella daihaiensis TaxID=2782176 RepID=A0ABY4AKJ6_9BURK|nr:GTP cyclohydrolase II [Orrella daihaiensis]UOD50787.1 GTP cyclohydrolase II [Orrella daihaiensis]
MNSPVAYLDPVFGVTSALSKVDRAAHELRRGDALIIQSTSGNFAVIAAEAVSDPLLLNLQAHDANNWHLVVTGQRAVRIGFEVDAQDSVYQLKAKQPVTTKSVQELVDPTISLNADTDSQAHSWHIDTGDHIDGAAVLLLKHAGLLPACVVVPLKDRMLQDSVCIAEADIRAGISEQRETLHIVSRARVPLEDAENVEIVAFRPEDGGTEHLAIIVGQPDLNQPVMIRLHSECFTGDLLGSLRCDCGSQLRGAISLMAATEGGILLYLAQEGRGIGLINKLRAYQLQDSGLDTVDANFDLGFEEDERDYMPAVQMLKHLNVRQVRVLTNNPRKVNALSRLGVNVVERVAHVFPANRHNRGYLMTKGTRGGHLFDLSSLKEHG